MKKEKKKDESDEKKENENEKECDDNFGENITIQSYWEEMAQKPSLCPNFDLEELFECRSKHIDKENGTWDPSLLLNGMRRTGKSVLGKHLVTEAHKRGLVGRISIITGTAQNGFWNDLIPLATIYDLSDPVGTLEMIGEFQKFIVESYKAGEDIPMGILQHTLILDDFIGDKSFARYSDAINTAIIGFRHYCICLIILTQYPTGVGPTIRNNADFVFNFLLPGEDFKNYVWKDHMSFILNKKTVFNILEQIPRDFRCLVIHKTDPYLNDQQKVSKFKAKDEDGDGHATLRAGNVEWRVEMDKIDKRLEQKKKERRKKMRQTLSQKRHNINQGDFSDIMEEIKNLKCNIINKLS